jgi:hypothetical protein
MKNKIQMFSLVVLLIYFLPKLLKIKGFTETIYFEIICFIAIISLAFFESKKLLKFDKLNNTDKFKQRILLVLSGLIVLILIKIYFNN